MPIQPKVQIDMSGLNAGIEAATKYTKRTLPQIVNTAAYWIAVNAKAGMPFVAPDKVDTELAVISHPVIGKRGKALKRKRAFSGGISAAQRNQDAPLAALIVVARARQGSRYNQRTNSRYALTRNPFKGVTRSAGQAAMKVFVDQMIKARHRSGKFLLAGWIPAIKRLMGYTQQKFMRGGASPNEGARNYYGSELGDAKPAVEGNACQAEIINDIGGQGVNATSFNNALMMYGAGPLQRAVDHEGKQQLDYALKKMESEMAGQVNKLLA